MKIDYIKCDPGGNQTALVYSTHDRSTYSSIAKKIMKQDPIIEQVGYIENSLDPTNSDARLHMMGGEFCGNAARCLAKFKSKELSKDKIDLEVSGAKDIISATIDSQGFVKIELPILQNWDSVKSTVAIIDSKKIPVIIVSLEGITHVLIDKNDFEVHSNALAMKIMDHLNLLDEEACGVISYEYLSNSEIKIIPYVWVKDMQNIIKETGCASGTIALVQAIAKQRDHSTKLNIIQPSNTKLISEVIVENKLFNKGTINGPVEILGSHSVELI